MEAEALWADNPMDDLLAALRAVAEPTRLRIVALSARGELTVSELVRILGQSQPRISRHLKLLTEAGLLTRHREGSWVFYRLAEDGPGAEVARHLNALLPVPNSCVPSLPLGGKSPPRHRPNRCRIGITLQVGDRQPQNHKI